MSNYQPNEYERFLIALLECTNITPGEEASVRWALDEINRLRCERTQHLHDTGKALKTLAELHERAVERMRGSR